jgi:hypothetical protein
MTKVELTFGLTRTVTEADMAAISRTYSVYGIQAVRLASSLDSVTVGFDASRLTEQSLENALIGCGIPLQRKDLPIGPSA